jgi:hypothetical protein
MPIRAPLACLLGALAALLIGVNLYQQTHAQRDENGLSPSEWSFIRVLYPDEARQAADMARSEGVLLPRCEQRAKIATQVCEGQMNLFDAAAEFKRLNLLPSPSSYNPIGDFPGDSENERVCWQVISWVKSNTIQMPPSQRQAVLDRLTADLMEHLACNGTVILPGD